MKRARAASILAAAVALASVSCGTDTGARSDGTNGSSAGETLTVFAAASLKDTFTEIAAQFEETHDGITVDLAFAGSSDLLAQLSQGAPADVFAPADTGTMSRAGDDGLVSGDPVPFVTNTLTIVTEAGNPKGIESFDDLTRSGVTVVVCAPQVPCGAATVRAEEATGVELEPVSEESSVTDVLGKITSGQADAGLVYVTDARSAGDNVTAVPFPGSADSVNTYPIAVLEDSQNPDTAQMFVDYVAGPEGRKILADAGFDVP
ncbi:molybdate ABC transporter substrate-binding protein [Rhodococcus coprophilus]|uniref:Molybdate ABC transporter molybdate-binding protein n=1 Tax=Rhodococcus coprophilus TaxID=38310 RepID=A0A2X4ULE6_9NOCA|nr:molybdate ABC transporter substrate-binding protein [Rhodococcus coprophilus]MBM7458845.1 molybdate transport system substrate-binding protein [Rhodococcus coprophilus]SQI33750.1 molybdate ABC transporter molybdate-binding protein [Rhodococcus coprophilus]